MCPQNELKQPNEELVHTFIKDSGESAAIMASYLLRKEGIREGKFDKKERELKGIKGFKTYKILCREAHGNKRKNDKEFDCDCCELVMSIWCCLLKQQGKTVLGYNKRTITYKNTDAEMEELMLETDTVHSVDTDLNNFIRAVINRKYGSKWCDLYEKGLGIENGVVVENKWPKEQRKCTEMNRDAWLLQNYNEIFDANTLTAEERKTLAAFDKFANATHTLGNIMLGPEGFNRAKGLSGNKDRLDIFLQKTCNGEYGRNYSNWFSSDIFLEVNHLEQNDNFIGSALRAGKPVDWIPKTDEAIEKRGEKIAEDLLRYLGYVSGGAKPGKTKDKQEGETI